MQAFLSGAGGAALVAGVFGLIQWALKRHATKTDKKTEKQEHDAAAAAQDMRSLKTIMQSLIIADRIILYDRIKYLAKSYIRREYITIEELEDLQQMHGVYHNELQGNGFLDGLMETVRSLDIRAA